LYLCLWFNSGLAFWVRAFYQFFFHGKILSYNDWLNHVHAQR
jgi:hypothetical protein